MRVGIIGLLHESNTFVPSSTFIEDFRQNTLLDGPAIHERFFDSHHELGGFLRTLARSDGHVETVPIWVARALPSGTIDAATFDELMDGLFSALDRYGPVDGLLVAPHGATVSQRYPDADGHWLARLRQHVGPGVPVVGTLDLHANLSATMVASCDALVAYRTNPHLDQEQRGEEAARILLRTLREEIRPTMAASFPPLAIGIETQDTAGASLVDVYQQARDQRANDNVVSNSLLLGFPYADVAEMGSAALVVTDNDAASAANLAQELGTAMWQRRTDYVGRLLSVNDAIDQCANLPGTICLLDMGDNVGGGSAADGTILATELHARRVQSAFVCLYDPGAVRAACQVGAGGRFSYGVGGHTDARHGMPLQAEWTVASLHEGKFEEPLVRHGGINQFDQGRTAIVQSDSGLTLMLTSLRMVPFSLEQLRSCGLRPASFRILVAKGVHAPVAAYEEVCQHLLRVNTAGSTCADMTQLEFRHRRRPMFPFETDTIWAD